MERIKAVTVQNLSHTQRFIPTTRKNIDSVWTSVVQEAVTDPGLTGQIITQLRKDVDDMRDDEQISDLCIVLPRAKGKSKGAIFGKNLAAELYGSRALESSVRYNRMLAKLAAYYRNLDLSEFNERTRFRQARGNDFSDQWENIRSQLHSRPLSDDIVHPTPARVDMRDSIDSLLPLISHLEFNHPVHPNSYSKELKQAVHIFPGGGALFPDGRLDLFKQGIGPNWIEPVIEALRSNDIVKHCNLGNNSIGQRGARSIATFIATQQPSLIQTWYLGGNEFDSDSISSICHALMDDRGCTSLWLKRNPIGPDGAVYLARLLRENTSIQLLDLHNTGLLDEGVKHVMEALIGNRSLRTLYIDANGIGFDSSVAIAQYFNAMVDTGRTDGITRLWMSMNRMDDAGVTNVLRSVRDYIPLQALSVGSNGCTANVAKELYECLRDLPNLTILDIGMYKATADLEELTNRIGDYGIPWIAKLLTENPHILAMSVSCNGVSENGLRHLCDRGVRNSDTLIHLEYQQYGLRVPDILAKEIDTKLELNWVHLARERGIDPSTKSQFIRSLKHSSLVKFIDSIYK